MKSKSARKNIDDPPRQTPASTTSPGMEFLSISMIASRLECIRLRPAMVSAKRGHPCPTIDFVKLKGFSVRSSGPPNPQLHYI